MHIGIDIDDTLSNSFESVFIDSQKFDIEELGNNGNIKHLGKIDNHDYIETMYPHWNNEQIDKFWEKYFINMLTKATPKDCAAEVLQKLKKEGNTISIITSRHEVIPGGRQIEEYSKRWLEKNNIPYDNFYLNAQDKAVVAKNAKVDLFIDDSIRHCKHVQENGIKSLLFTTTMNEAIDVEGIERVYSWVQVYNKVRFIA